MRGNDGKQNELFSYVSLEARVPRNHPLRKMREMVDEALEGLSSDFDEMYSRMGRPSIPPEHLLEQEISRKFFEQILKQAKKRQILSSEHFTVDGTFIEAWASQKSFKRKDDQDPPA